MKSKRFISLSLMLGLTTGMFVGLHQSQRSSIVVPVEASAPANYYSTVTDSMTGTTLLNQLTKIINTSNVSVSYDWSRYEAADQDPNNSRNVILIYARNSVPKSQHVSGEIGWNREHTYPNSKITGKAESDNHIIFASDNKVNGARSNIKMGVVNEGTVVKDWNGKDTTCRKTSNAFDPHNVARGIVARSTMYAAAMYGLAPTGNFESVATMLRWHLEYLPDSNDMRRNDVVYSNQKNRNPFVDHPEYACRIWGETNNETRQICGQVVPALTISTSSLTIANGGTAQISATSSTGTSITWATSNASVCSISSTSSASGAAITLTGASLGTAKITAQTVIEGQTLLRECNVTVSDAPTINSVSLDKTNLTLGIDEGYELKLIPDPSGATLPEFTWTSSNEQVATVSSNGLVMARGVGSAVITAKSTNPAFTLTCNVTVVPPGGPSSGGGCGGNVITTSVILSTLSILGIGLILIKRKFIK